MSDRAQNWREYWNSASIVRSESPMRQVGKTVRGEPFAESALEAIEREIVDTLAIDATDAVLDLGCGNGMVTRRIARRCRSVTGVDFSVPLLAVANAIHGAENIRYVAADITALAGDILSTPYAKIYAYEVLQHVDGAG